jgi:predicted amino acid-binding ACT domain protein
MPRREIFLLTVKGERARPGLTAALAETMGKHDVTVLDIGQAGQPHCSPRSLTLWLAAVAHLLARRRLNRVTAAEIHDMLSLGMLIEAPAEPGLNVLKEIVFMAHHLGLTGGGARASDPAPLL